MLSFLFAASAFAQSAPCYDTATYVQFREALDTLPDARERAAIGDAQIEAALEVAETSLVRFLATAGQSCRTAQPAYEAVEAAADDLTVVLLAAYPVCPLAPEFGCSCYFEGFPMPCSFVTWCLDIGFCEPA